MRTLTLLLFLIPGMLLCRDSSILHLNLRKEIAVFAGSGTVAGSSVLIGHSLNALTPDQLSALNPGHIPPFDRWSIGNYHHPAAITSDVLLYGSMLVPEMLFLADPATRKSPVKPAIIMSEVFAVNYGLTSLTKELAHRTRPYAYDPLVPTEIKLQRDARRSFFSGHTSTSAAMCFGYATIWSTYHPDSPLKPLVWTSAALVPAITGYMRVRAGEHFLSDVLVGYGAGALCGWLVARWHRKSR